MIFIKNLWKTKDGKQIEVEEMTTSHIINCINCIENGKIQFVINMGWSKDNDYQEFDEDIDKKETWLKVFRNELKRRKYI